MTMMMVELLRVRGDERWEEWGDQWWDHVDRVGEVSKGINAWRSDVPLRRAGFTSRQLDWGAWLYEMSKAELIDLFGPDVELIPSWPRRRNGERWRRAITELDEEARFGLVIVECY